MNIALILDMAADTAPDRVGLVCDGRRYTYGQIRAGAQRAAAIVTQSGAGCVAHLDVGSEAAIFALFGAALSGVPYCPLNYRLADADLAGLLERIAPAVVIGDTARAAPLSPDAGHTFLTREQFVEKSRSGPAAGADGSREEEIAVQLFTSGTTAAPKAAILTHANLASYIFGTVEFGAASDAEAVLVCVPPYHIAGIASILSSIYALRRIALLSDFSPEAWLRLSASENVTNAFVVPTMLSRIIEHIDRRSVPVEFPALRAIAYGGGRMPTELIQRALDLFPSTDFTNAYGLTETSSTIALLSPADHRAAKGASDPCVRARLGSVGKPLPTIELEIRDEDGRMLPAGEIGEVYVRGDQVSGRYKERSALHADGWFPTRDAGYLDDEGYLFLCGRADDVIVRGGENISPGEIEDVLMTHPAVADVAAVAVPSPEWGEAVGVAVVVREGKALPSTEELKELVRSRLRSSRVPEMVRFLPCLPYNEMGKLLRREIKAGLAS